MIQESAEPFVFRKKGNKQQSDFNRKIFHVNEHALTALKNRQYERAQQELEEGRHLISKRQKVIKLADKSQFGWGTVNEYLMAELASDRRAAQKSKERLASRNKSKVTVTANQFHSNRYNFDPFRTSSKIPINFFRHNNANNRTCNDICYRCGKPGHWAKFCKEQPV